MLVVVAVLLAQTFHLQEPAERLALVVVALVVAAVRPVMLQLPILVAGAAGGHMQAALLD